MSGFRSGFEMLLLATRRWEGEVLAGMHDRRVTKRSLIRQPGAWGEERRMTASPDPLYSSPNSRSSRRIGSGIASMLAAALPRSGGASLSVR